MKYLVKNSTTNVIELQFETPIIPSSDLEVIPVSDQQYRGNMLRSIFVDVDHYKPYPSNDIHQQYWISDGINWVDSRSDDEVWEEVRRLRDEELSLSDWTQLPDADFNSDESTTWTNYRAALRDAVNNSDPRSAETAIQNIKKTKPDKNNTDPRRGRGRGNPPERFRI